MVKEYHKHHNKGILIYKAKRFMLTKEMQRMIYIFMEDDGSGVQVGVIG